jgi:hemin uptake protein HemP
MNGSERGGVERLHPNRAPSSFIAAIRSEQVLAGDKEVAIEHGGDIYWLRRTRNNKLILTK